MKHIERIVSVTDDLGGAGEAQSIAFSFEGVDYSVDLNKRNHETFVRRMKPYIDAGRPVQAKKAGVEDASAIRRWAVARGYELSTRGRVPAHIIRAYESQSDDAA